MNFIVEAYFGAEDNVSMVYFSYILKQGMSQILVVGNNNGMTSIKKEKHCIHVT